MPTANAPDAYARYPEGQVTLDPKGPAEGTEWVVRGGSYQSDAADVRSAAREPTQTDAWLKTDPQVPKSKWWYSDCTTVGFRVVRGGAALRVAVLQQEHRILRVFRPREEEQMIGAEVEHGGRGQRWEIISAPSAAPLRG